MFTKVEHAREIAKLVRQIAKAKAKGRDYSALEARLFELLND